MHKPSLTPCSATHGPDKQVIAEWVETPEVLNLLLGMGTQFGQGDLFHQPAPLESDVRPAISAINVNAA